jgi:hypothetical protein
MLIFNPLKYDLKLKKKTIWELFPFSPLTYLKQ